jgi:pimeloyl-ACP methyl ester carboxylesterase
MKTTTFSTALLTVAIALAAAACGSSTTSDAATTVPAPTTALTSATTMTPITERPSQTVDKLVGIDNGQLHLRCVGAGSSTVLLIAGWQDAGDKWGAIEPAIADRGRVCSYSRFGTGTSDAPSTTQTFATQAADLHALLNKAGEPGPYVVVGHSFGGAEAVTFASTYADEVTGLMLLDASPKTWPATVCSVPAYEAGCAVMRDPTLDPERLDAFPAFAELATIDSLGDLPMTIMTAAHRDPSGLTDEEVTRLEAEWAVGMEEWAQLSLASSVVVVEDTGHHIELDQPQLVIDELSKLLP